MVLLNQFQQAPSRKHGRLIPGKDDPPGFWKGEPALNGLGVQRDLPDNLAEGLTFRLRRCYFREKTAAPAERDQAGARRSSLLEARFEGFEILQELC